MTPWRLQRYASLPSTSDLCVTLARAGEPAGLAVLAGEQTAGRGSRGRSWQSPPGNFHLSVLLRPHEPAARAGLWSLLGAVALRDALAASTPLTLKWPNDVLRDGRKLAGILIDSAVAAEGRLEWLVIGFGANLAAAPPGAARLAGSPDDVAASVLERIDHYADAGSAHVRETWLRYAHPPGTQLRFSHGGAEITGSFVAIAENGALELRVNGRVQTFSTGEVLLSEWILKGLP